MQLIMSSLRLIGVLASGEQPSTSEANDALAVFNDLLDAWNADRLAIFTTSSQDFPFTLSQQSYTMGPGGDFNVARPARIDNMSAILLNNPDNPIEEPINLFSVEEWQQEVPVKQVFGSFPQICYDDGGYPLRTLSFWPIPNVENAVRIYSWQALAQAANLATSIAFPPGYSQAFRFNLAIQLAPEYAIQPPAVVAAVANESLARLKTMNAPDVDLRSDLLPSPSMYNWSASEFNNPYS